MEASVQANVASLVGGSEQQQRQQKQPKQQMQQMQQQQQQQQMQQIQQIQQGQLQPQHYSLPGVLHFLQSEWRVFERERNLWEIERADLKARVAFLEGERQALEHLKSDLLRRVKMLEYSLRQERAKYLQLSQQHQLSQKQVSATVPISTDPILTSNEISIEANQLVPSDHIFSSANLHQGNSTAMQNPSIDPSSTDSDSPSFSVFRGDAGGLVVPVGAIEALSSMRNANGNLLNFSKGYGNLRSRELLKSYLKEADSLLATTTWASSISGRHINTLSLPDSDRSYMPIDTTSESTSEMDASAASSIKNSTATTMQSQQKIKLLQNSVSGTGHGVSDKNHSMESKKAAVKPQLFQKKDTEEGGSSLTIRPNRAILTKNNAHTAPREDEDSSIDNNKTIRRSGNSKAVVHFDVTEEQETYQSNDAEDSMEIDDNTTQKSIVSTRKDFSWQLRDTLKSHFDAVRDVAFHPKEMILFSASEDHTVKMWPLGTNASHDLEPLYTFRGHKDVVTSLAVSCEGGRMYSAGGDATICIWRIPSQEGQPYPAYDPTVRQHVFVGHSDMIWDLCLHPFQGQFPLLASASADGTIKLWDTTVGSPALKSTLWYTGSANGGRSAERNDRPSSMTVNSDFEIPTVSGWTNTDLTKLVVGYRNSVIKMFDIETGLEALKFVSNISSSANAQVNTLVCHPTQSLVITGHEDTSIRLFDINSGKCIHSIAAHSESVSSLDVSSSGLTFVSGDHDCSIRWWDLSMRRCLQEQSSHRKKYDAGIWSVQYHPLMNDVVASGGADGTCKVYKSMTVFE
ncbi:hypothetical protein BASA60_003090 [Batrachochytrium salamandrivorans]|nr:hypothetical protein BASA60_003090 [Batrachochytrium salamandrivorans]